MPVHLTCPRCGDRFDVPPSRVGVRRYCSKICMDARVRARVIVDGEIALVPLTRKDGTIRAYAIVDAADATWADQWNWHLTHYGYARRSDGSQKIWLHRDLIGLVPNDGQDVDHKDRDRLNCRRSNLRVVPYGKNQQNMPSMPGASSSHRGVHWNARGQKWCAQIYINGRSRQIGTFATELEAAEAARSARLNLMPYAVD